MPRIIIMHDNGTEEIQDYCVVCFPTADEAQKQWEGQAQWIKHNPPHGHYCNRPTYCANPQCRKLLSAEDGSDNTFTTIIPINGKLNYEAG